VFLLILRIKTVFRPKARLQAAFQGSSALVYTAGARLRRQLVLYKLMLSIRGLTMNRVFLVLVATFLFGCTTPSQMREAAPVAQFSSAKTAKSVALCVVNHWENSGIGGTPSVTFRPTETGFTVAVRNEMIGSTQLLADISDSPAGSTTRYFKGAVLGEGAFDAGVKACQ
jgi:hypothetical protein